MDDTYNIGIKCPAENCVYGIVVQPPTVPDTDKVRTPILHVTDESGSEGDILNFSFEYKYGVFIGKIVNNSVAVTNEAAIKVATEKSDGSVIDVFFDGTKMKLKDMEKNPPQGTARKTASASGTIEIHCGEQTPPQGRSEEYVVGLAFCFGEEVKPIATMPYMKGKRYVVTPSFRICICRDYEKRLRPFQMLDARQQKFVAVDFPHKARSVRVSEDDQGDYYIHSAKGKSLLEKGTLAEIGRGKTGPLPHFESQPPPQPRFRTSARVPAWKINSDKLKLDFTIERQWKAFNFLYKYNREYLASYHKQDKLVEIAKKAKVWGDKITANPNLKDELLDHLLVLALFDCILFLDNSSSIDWDNERSEDRSLISQTIVEVEAIYENTADVKVVFLNGPNEVHPVATSDDMAELLEKTDNFGSTPLGTELKRKILDKFVEPKLKAGTPFRPILITTITDGVPYGEKYETFQNYVHKCEEDLKKQRAKSGIGGKHVLFQISRVGSDEDAKKFIKDLKENTELRNILHCTSYRGLDLDPHATDPIEAHATVISRLAGAAFIGLPRDDQGRFKFLQTPGPEVSSS